MKSNFDIKVSNNIKVKFKEISKRFSLGLLNDDKYILKRLFQHIPDLPDKNK